MECSSGGIARTTVRGPSKDSEGYLLGYHKANDYDEYSPDLKSFLAVNHGIIDKTDYLRFAEGTCLTCPADAPSMPHREENCPPKFATQPESEQKLGAARHAAQMRRLLQQIGKGTKSVSLLDAARECDKRAHDPSVNHVDACEFVIAVLGAASEDDISADDIDDVLQPASWA